MCGESALSISPGPIRSGGKSRGLPLLPDGGRFLSFPVTTSLFSMLSRSEVAECIIQPKVKPMAMETAELIRMVFKMFGWLGQASRMAEMAAAMSLAPKVVEPATMTFAALMSRCRIWRSWAATNASAMPSIHKP